MTDRDYVLGTHDAEIERLKLQHRVWRPRMYDAWRRAGITQGQTVVDVGGRVIAVERSARFLDVLRQARAPNVIAIEGDVTETPIGEHIADAAWCRWVFSWVTKPELGVANIARALKPGGVAVFHEYLHYASWGLAPHSPAFSAFVTAVCDSIAKTGANIDSALGLPRQLEDAGFDIVALTPIIDVVAPDNYVWLWPTAFARSFGDKLVADGLLTTAQAADAVAALDRAESEGGVRMVTPVVLEIIARRR